MSDYAQRVLDGLKARNAHETEFLLCLMQTASDLSRKFTFGEAAELFRHYSEESFVAFYLSKKWDLMRPLGLLQI